MATAQKKQRNYRFSKQTLEKIEELKSIYNIKSENELVRKIIDDIYEIKKSKSLIPYEELKAKDDQLHRLIFEIGKLKGIVEEKEKKIKEFENRKKPSFFARLFGNY